MSEHSFDYEDVFMGVAETKPKTYFLSFKQDHRLRSLVRTVHLQRGNILDIGCGGGRIAETLPYYYPHASIFGCDVSKTAISYAKKLGSGKVTYHVMKINRFPYKDSYFAVCLCLDVLEHVPNVSVFLSEIRRVLKKHGKFFLIVPCEGEPLTFTWFFTKLNIGRDLTRQYFGHIHPEFTHRYVIELLRKNGFTIKKISYSEHAVYQFIFLFIFYIPKAMLTLFLGDRRAHEYTNSSLIRTPKNVLSPLMIVRKIWFWLFDFMMYYPMHWETILLRNLPTAAWKLHVLVENK